MFRSSISHIHTGYLPNHFIPLPEPLLFIITPSPLFTLRPFISHTQDTAHLAIITSHLTCSFRHFTALPLTIFHLIYLTMFILVPFVSFSFSKNSFSLIWPLLSFNSLNQGIAKHPSSTSIPISFLILSFDLLLVFFFSSLNCNRSRC